MHQNEGVFSPDIVCRLQPQVIPVMSNAYFFVEIGSCPRFSVVYFFFGNASPALSTRTASLTVGSLSFWYSIKARSSSMP